VLRRRRAVGRGGELADLRPLQAQRSQNPLDDIGVPRDVVALVERHIPLVSDRQHTPLFAIFGSLQTVGRASLSEGQPGMTATPSFIEKGTWLTEESRLWFA
jgi:hypothetical protein